MGSIKPPNGDDAFSVDFKSTPKNRIIAFRDHLDFGTVAFVRGTSRPIEGFRVRSPQVTVAIHESATYRLDWRSADSDRLRSSEISRGHAHEKASALRWEYIFSGSTAPFRDYPQFTKAA